MTSTDVLNAIRMLLDDNVDYDIPTSHIVAMVNEAQNTVIMDALKEGDERCLKPLYRVTDLIANGDTINNIMVTRACRVYATNAQADKDSAIAQYLNPAVFSNLETDFYINNSTKDDRDGYYYTLEKNGNNGVLKYNATDTDTRAKVVYIKSVTPFTTTVKLEIPTEYYAKVIFRATELLIAQDVNEQQRSVLGDNGLSITKVGEA